jgi:hypothetical protein
MTLLSRLSILCFLGSATYALAFEITTASTQSFEANGFHCKFSGRTASQRIFFNDGGVASTGALVGIDGNNVLLPQQREGPKVKDRLRANFKGGSTFMDISAVVVKSCEGLPENCERWQYATTIQVRRNGAFKTLKGVSECGA